MVTYRWLQTKNKRWIYTYWKNNQIVCFLDFELVAANKQCTGSEIFQGKQKTIDQCSKACKGKATMFIYGQAPNQQVCDEQGCKCLCETSSKNGKCTMTNNIRYNLYAYSQFKTGEVVIIITFFCHLRIIFTLLTVFASEAVNAGVRLK